MVNGQARLFVVLGALFALLAVGAGAFGAHGLRARLDPAMLAVFETAARYQMYHALALVAAGASLAVRPTLLARLAGWFFAAGIVLFSGSLYALALGGPNALGPVTPFGGLAFMAGWACLAGWAALASEKRRS
jgi:uncharacterized membrane protein YgdD (TMEM256/DUF423 family)